MTARGEARGWCKGLTNGVVNPYRTPRSGLSVLVFLDDP
jgi:hypothetical protein